MKPIDRLNRPRMTYAQIGRALGISRQNVEQMERRALKKLRAALEKLDAVREAARVK